MIDLDYSDSLNSLRPNANYSVIGNNYDSIIWNDNNYTKPTKSELDTELIRLRHEWKMNEIRQKRDRLLVESDKYSLSDFPHSTDEIKNSWLSYRQLLRNITNNLDTTSITIDIDDNGEIRINNLTWPIPPS
uniref:Phage tail assembly chaperone-like domain-containing protein n=1 Tax=viral metagenome TaxID=1070528 RepID=A0A6C0BTV8_9ZZZZ